MDASVVYDVAMALPHEERVRLYNMLKSEVVPQAPQKKATISTLKFSDDEALEYLIEKFKI
ncbi:hypothetical protein [Mangrovimonas cancribranchiae]|uniref:Uncharacterized protein n=1 Tax=Mangrovimonas cancribranchiae TaxID=3080055 RepID=A0AAU6NXM6_9FLAO